MLPANAQVICTDCGGSAQIPHSAALRVAMRADSQGGGSPRGFAAVEMAPSYEMWPDLVHEIGPRSNGVCTRKRASPPRRDSEPSLREIFRRVHGLGRAATGFGNTLFRGGAWKTRKEFENESLPIRLRTTSIGLSSTTVVTAATRLSTPTHRNGIPRPSLARNQLRTRKGIRLAISIEQH